MYNNAPNLQKPSKTYKEHPKHIQTLSKTDSIKSMSLDETDINEEYVIGKAVVRIPLLGYIKIWFVELIKIFVR